MAISTASSKGQKVSYLLLTMVVCLAGLITTGCYNPEDVKAFLLKHKQMVTGTEYRVYPPDVISIRSLHVPEIDGATERIRPDGKINLPLLGEISVVGKTPKEIEQALAEAAKDFYEEADATVRVAGYNSRKFYIFGQVSRPGPMPWTGRDTFLDAIAKAQPTTLAWPERIIVVRGNGPIEGGYYRPAKNPDEDDFRKTGIHAPHKDTKPSKVTINMMAMIEHGDYSHNIMLMPNDIIYVQPNPYARVGLWLRNVLFPVQPIIQTLSIPAMIDRTADDLDELD